MANELSLISSTIEKVLSDNPSSTNGLLLRDLQRRFKEVVGHSIDFEKYKCGSLVKFLMWLGGYELTATNDASNPIVKQVPARVNRVKRSPIDRNWRMNRPPFHHTPRRPHTDEMSRDTVDNAQATRKHIEDAEIILISSDSQTKDTLPVTYKRLLSETSTSATGDTESIHELTVNMSSTQLIDPESPDQSYSEYWEVSV